ncbi:TCR/Tet family MFS transporter [Solilutibacter silvestris]|uniref:Major Facilitator Superfamily protein n=1 Tax=Solilutibacter silvestris TaxID=1645665 RepID=A0A2K1Q184_9GAMM|nr:TCR/Tet family MFS transporter [Lysobacter silvestris]PNS08803.1 Major Facilitator Superfamily protein [Lysobacter silvestris]
MDITPLPQVRRAAVAFIFITVMLDVLAIGVIIPVLPHIIKDMAGGSFIEATRWSGWFGTAFMVMQFVFTPVQGALSDHFGRRPIILLSNLGLGLDFILMALVNTLPLLFIGRIISGITSASFSTANAYIADVTPFEKRAAAFGMMGAAFGLGFIIGPALGSTLSHWGPRVPFWGAAVLSLANFCYGLLVLPESLPKDRRVATDWKRANPVGSLMLLKRYPQVFTMAWVVFLFALAQFAYNSTFVLNVDYRFHWGEQQVGYVLGLVGVLTAVVQGFLVGKIIKKLGERRALLVGTLCGLIALTGYGLTSHGWVFLALMPLGALMGMAGPVVQSVMTRQVDPHEQGRLQGALASLQSVAGMIGPLLFTGVFAHFIDPKTPLQIPGSPFLLAALLVALALVVAWKSMRGTPVAAVEELPVAAPQEVLPP